MARNWSGFIPQNMAAKEEWALLEACEVKARFGETGACVHQRENDWVRSARQLQNLVDLLEKSKFSE